MIEKIENAIVLLEPEIPQNTGNIARTCAATGASLHLIHPLGFDTSEKQVRRAGLDYWNLIKIYHYENYQEYLSKNPEVKKIYFTTKSTKTYPEADYSQSVHLIFGKESAGIPEEILVANKKDCVRIPMISQARSLNLSNAAAIAIYEACRQQSFENLKTEGSLHRLEW